MVSYIVRMGLKHVRITEIRHGISEYVGNIPAKEIARLYQEFRNGGDRQPLVARTTVEQRTQMNGAPTRYTSQPLFDTPIDHIRSVRVTIEAPLQGHDTTSHQDTGEITRFLITRGLTADQILITPTHDYYLHLDPSGIREALLAIHGEHTKPNYCLLYTSDAADE